MKSFRVTVWRTVKQRQSVHVVAADPIDAADLAWDKALPKDWDTGVEDMTGVERVEEERTGC